MMPGKGNPSRFRGIDYIYVFNQQRIAINEDH